MQEIVQQMIERAIEEAKRENFFVRGVHDGEELIPTQTVSDVLELVETQQSSTIHFVRAATNDRQAVRSLLVVVPEQGQDCFADWTEPPEFSEAIGRAVDAFCVQGSKHITHQPEDLDDSLP